MNITLDNERSEKLARLAARTGAHRVTVVNSLLACAIDQADPDAGSVVELLDGIDGAYERATLGSGRRTAATRCRPTRCS